MNRGDDPARMAGGAIGPHLGPAVQYTYVHRDDLPVREAQEQIRVHLSAHDRTDGIDGLGGRLVLRSRVRLLRSVEWGPCRKCFKRRRCDNRRLFCSGAKRSAQILIITTWRLRREELWGLKAMKDRPLVVLDEDSLSALAAPAALTVEPLPSSWRTSASCVWR